MEMLTPNMILVPELNHGAGKAKGACRLVVHDMPVDVVLSEVDLVDVDPVVGVRFIEVALAVEVIAAPIVG